MSDPESPDASDPAQRRPEITSGKLEDCSQTLGLGVAVKDDDGNDEEEAEEEEEDSDDVDSGKFRCWVKSILGYNKLYCAV